LCGLALPGQRRRGQIIARRTGASSAGQSRDRLAVYVMAFAAK
jgi:hypothetical protein